MGIFIISCSIALFVAVFSSPLLGTLSAEAALLLGIVLGPLSFIAGVKRGALRNSRGFSRDFIHEGMHILAALCFFIIAAFCNSFRFESCADDKGLVPVLILVLPVLWLNLVVGIWIGRLIGKTSIAVLASIFLILLYLGFQIAWWWHSPSLRFFNHHLVIIVGDLLAGQSLNPSIIAYRTSTLLFGIAFFIFGILVFKDSTRKSQTNSTPRQLGLFGIAVLITVTAFWIQIKSSQSISPSRTQLEKHYSLQEKRGILILHADPTSTTNKEAEAILAEGALWLERLTLRTGITPTRNIHIWLHRDMEIQNRYTGAKNVHFTLPVHREIHISSAQIPHSTLGHELAHIFISEKSTTLFGFAGILGLFPNYGLNEGLAVFLTPELAIANDLTLMEQAAAIDRLEYLKDFDSLFSIKPWNFWFESSARAYIAAGAYLEYLISQKTKNNDERQALIQKLCSAGELFPVWDSKQDRKQFSTNFKKYLQSLPLPQDALGSARERFKAPAIIYAECHENSISNPVDLIQTTEEKGDALWKMNRLEEALQKYNEIDLPSLSLSKQRQVTIKIAFAKAAIDNNQIKPLAFSVYKLFTPTDEYQTLSAQLAFIGFFIAKSINPSTQKELWWVYGNYLWARHQIIGGNYDSGLSGFYDFVIDAQIPESFYFESKRLMAYAHAMKHEPMLAYDIYLELQAKDTRRASQLMLQDLMERALKAHKGLIQTADPSLRTDQWLLGI